MALIQFVNNYEDLSTDRGYQFRFHCDKCGNGHMSRFEPSVIGTAGSFLRAASTFFGGWIGSAGDSAYEIQRAVGGKAHDNALAAAVEAGRQHFHQCSRCGKWVCPDVCWNHKAGQCEDCAPDFEEQMASAHAHARSDMMREQMYDKARATDFVANVDMRGGTVLRKCPSCGMSASGKFCAECGAKFG